MATVPSPSSAAAAKGADMEGGVSLDRTDPLKVGLGHTSTMDIDHNASHATSKEVLVEAKK